MEVIKISDIKKHLDDLRLLKDTYKKDGELWKAAEDRIHVIEKMVEMLPHIEVVEIEEVLDLICDVSNMVDECEILPDECFRVMRDTILEKIPER